MTGYNSWYEKYEAECIKYNQTSAERVTKLSLPNENRNRLVWKRVWFDHLVQMPFEFLTIPVPAGYMEFLDAYFGEWKIPVRDPSIHGGMIFDTTRSYLQYFKDKDAERKAAR